MVVGDSEHTAMRKQLFSHDIINGITSGTRSETYRGSIVIYWKCNMEHANIFCVLNPMLNCNDKNKQFV